MKIEELIGKEIVDAKYKRIDGFDDRAWMELTFSDGTKTLVVANYGGYSGHSQDEYPSFIRLEDESEIDEKLIDV